MKGAVAFLLLFVMLAVSSSRAQNPEIVPFKELTVKPKIIKYTEPVYPEKARHQKHEGLVVLKATLDTTGKIIDASVLKSSGYPELDESALECVKKWQYSPGQKEGKPVFTRVTIPVQFRFLGVKHEW